jgi:hypothetical protein
MQREGALQSLCQMVKEVLILEIAQTYQVIVCKPAILDSLARAAWGSECDY